MPRTTRATAKAARQKHKTRISKVQAEEDYSRSEHPVRNDDRPETHGNPKKIAKAARKSVRCRQDRLRTLVSSEDHPETRHHGSEAAYYGDDEEAMDMRRMSHDYGHGYVLGENASPPPVNGPRKSSLSRKRKGSFLPTEQSPKRVQFNSDTDEMRFIQEGKVESVPFSSEAPYERPELEMDLDIGGEDFGEYSELPENPDEFYLDQMMERPTVLDVSQIAAVFEVVQWRSELLSKNWFGVTSLYDDEATLKERFPLHDLERNNSALYLTTACVLDASTTDGLQSGWLKFFTEREYRPYLVSGILGEWLTQRIFKDTSFGLSAEAKETMKTEIDQNYMNFDAFIRAKLRAQFLEHYIIENQHSHHSTLIADCESLASELMTVLDPLLPDVAKQEVAFKSSLVELIRICASLNLSIVRSGEEGMVVRTAHRLEKDKTYSPMAPMRCINPHVFDTDAPATEGDRPVVKMTCWPRVEAYVPNGMDMLQMDKLQNDLLETQINNRIESIIEVRTAKGKGLQPKHYNKAVQNGFCWDCAGGREEWDILPQECWHYAIERKKKNESKVRSADLREKESRKRMQNQRYTGQGGGDPDSSSSDSEDADDSCPTPPESRYSSSSGSSDGSLPKFIRSQLRNTVPQNETDVEIDPPRGAWITVYDCLTPHAVYCEMAKPEAVYVAELQAQGVDLKGQSIRQFNGLPSAVKQARKNFRSYRMRWEDAQLRLWNNYASHNLTYEWLGLAAASVILLTRTNFFGNASEMLVSLANLAGAVVENGYGLLQQAAFRTSFGINELLHKMTGNDAYPKLEMEEVLEYSKELLRANWENLHDKWDNLIAILVRIIPTPGNISIAPERVEEHLGAAVQLMSTPTPTSVSSPGFFAGLSAAAFGGTTTASLTSNPAPTQTLGPTAIGSTRGGSYFHFPFFQALFPRDRGGEAASASILRMLASAASRSPQATSMQAGDVPLRRNLRWQGMVGEMLRRIWE